MKDNFEPKILKVNGREFQISSLNEFETVLSQFTSIADLEIWIIRPDGNLMSALINEGGGWLMYMIEPSGDWFSSRNLSREDDLEATSEYTLANGQVDEYPNHWGADREFIFAALKEYAETHQPTELINWHKD